MAAPFAVATPCKITTSSLSLLTTCYMLNIHDLHVRCLDLLLFHLLRSPLIEVLRALTPSLASPIATLSASMMMLAPSGASAKL